MGEMKYPDKIAVAISFGPLDSLLSGEMPPLPGPASTRQEHFINCITAARTLLARMSDPASKVGCLTCDHAFPRGSRPRFVCVSVPLITEACRREPTVSAICGKCARLPREELRTRVMNAFQQFDLEARTLGTVSDG
jgi:hypothetical protein